jgi:hypothetical protein
MKLSTLTAAKTILMPHKYQSTINIIKEVIHKLPCVFPQERHQEMENAIAAFERDSDAKLEDIEAKLIAFGAELWPYGEAHDAFHKIHGAEAEKRLMAAKLSPPSRAELEKFLQGGGDIESVRQGDKFEHFFSPEIRAELIEAELAAHDEVHEEMEKLMAGDKRRDFDALLANYREKLAAIMKKIDELESLGRRPSEWQAEIIDKSKSFREGFAYLERAPTLDDVSREVQYYIDIMEG